MSSVAIRAKSSSKAARQKSEPALILQIFHSTPETAQKNKSINFLQKYDLSGQFSILFIALHAGVMFVVDEVLPADMFCRLQVEI